MNQRGINRSKTNVGRSRSRETSGCEVGTFDSEVGTLDSEVSRLQLRVQVRYFPCAALLALIWIGGCTRFHRTPSLPVANSVALTQLVVYADFDLPSNHRLLHELDAMREYIGGTLELPPSVEPINVYLFKTPRRYRAFIREHHPDFPDRRAFFVKTEAGLQVYAQWGDRIAEDLRHETAHGYLHAAVAEWPLWLDEGLAEYFEVERAQHGRHEVHLQELLAGLEEKTWQPNLRGLEALDGVHSMAQMQYAESWAWVHFLLHTTPERRELLLGYLRDLREHRAHDSLADRLLGQEPRAERLLVDYLDAIRRR